jgi:hypothetical protein
MKKILSILALLCLGFTSYAQQGDIHINNSSGCNIAIDIVAACDNCTETSSLTMHSVGANSTLDFQSSSYPWNGGGTGAKPPCGNWEWYYADIFICGNYYRVGRNVSSCTPYGGSLGVTDCGCNGSNITLNFSVDAAGNVLIQIF